jgi:hypothetical protein
MRVFRKRFKRTREMELPVPPFSETYVFLTWWGRELPRAKLNADAKHGER